MPGYILTGTPLALSRHLGFTLIEVAAGPLPDRVAVIERTVERLR